MKRAGCWLAAVANGLPWAAGLAAITANPAEIFGLGAEQVWIDGRPQSMRSRQTELRDRYRR